MRSLFFSLFIGFLLALPLAGQGEFYARASKTEVEAGQILEVEFVIRNRKGDFQAPDFTPFVLVAGPMQSSSFQSINGQVSQEYRYKYILRAPEEGFYMLPEGELLSKEKLLFTDPLEITVLPAGQQQLQKHDTAPILTPSLRQILQRKKIKRF